MNQKIAVERHLTQVKDLLSSKGYQVDIVDTGEVSASKIKDYSAIVINGLSENFLGIQDTSTKAAVINAEGMSADEVYKEIQTRLK
ncbi:MAG: hypothetical protein K0R31_1091 [Clostridiales bacterium]|nr:hypothetical protein [Clostridiales bacterium]